jgi:hypothetical protein
MGANCDTAAIRAEARENNIKFGTPDDDNLPNPATGNSGDVTLPNPHNFSSNPGFMGTSTASALMSAAPRPGVGLGSGMGRGPDMRPTRVGGPQAGRSPISTKGNVAMPAPGDTDPRSEGSPQGRTSGFGG